MSSSAEAIAQKAEALQSRADRHKELAAFHRRKMHLSYARLDELRETAKALGLELVIVKSGGGKKPWPKTKTIKRS